MCLPLTGLGGQHFNAASLTAALRSFFFTCTRSSPAVLLPAGGYYLTPPTCALSSLPCWASPSLRL